MRKMWVALALACAVGMVPPPAADAGGKGAVKTDLLVAEYPEDRPPSVVVQPEVDVGNVIFNTTPDDRMKVMVKLKDVVPDTTYRVFAVPLDSWGPGIDQAVVTSNRYGQGTVRLARPIPEGASDPVEITLIVRKEIRDPDDPGSRANWVVYKTTRQFLRLK